MRLLHITFVFLLLCISLKSIAVQRELYFNNLSLEQGLNQGAIYSLTKDPYGFTWIGTQDGLHRFDGNTMDLVPLSATKLPKYRYVREINSINNLLYVATTDGLVVVDLITGDKSYPDVHGAAIYSVIEVNQQIWLGTDIGLIILNSDHEMVKYYGKGKIVNDAYSFCKIPSSPKICSSEVRTLVFDKLRKTVWIGTNTGLLEFNLEAQRSHSSNNLKEYVHYHQVDTGFVAGNTIRKLFIDSRHKLWIASYHGLHYLDLNGTDLRKKFQNIYHKKNSFSSIASNRVLAIAEDESGGLWVGTNKGLSFYENKPTQISVNFDDGWQNFYSNNSGPRSLIDNLIRSLLIDEEGRIWVGTNKGLSVTNTQRLQVATFRATNSNSFNNYILSISEESKGKYWLGTRKGLYAFANKIAYSQPLLKDNVVYDTLIISGYIWAGTRRGLYKINLITQEVSQHYNANNSPVGDTFIYKLINVNGNIWVGTTSGLHKLDISTGQWQSWYEKDGLVDSQIYTLHEYHNKLWIGTRKGLSLFDLNSNLIKNYSPKNSSLQSPWVFNINPIDNESYLIASDGGIYEFNLNNESFDYIGVTQGNAYGSIRDEQGFFWITSNNGLYRFDAYSKKFTKFVEKHGFASNEYNLNAILKNSQGELLLGTINGFVQFKPEKLIQNESLLKKRLVSSIQVDQQRYALWEKLTLIDNTPAFLAEDIFLSWRDAKIELQLSNPYFAIVPPSQDIDFAENINLSNMQSGSYPIALSPKQNNSIQVHKQPHPLLSWWALITYLLLFSAMLSFFIRYRLMSKFNAEILINNKVIAQQKEVIEQHMLFKQDLYLKIQHSFKSPVFACRGLSKQINSLLANNSFFDKHSIERKNNKLFTGLNEISALIDEFIVLTKQQPDVKITSKQYVLETFVQVEALMTDVAINKNISLALTCDKSLTELDHIIASEKCLYLILENVISNAIKFSQHNSAVQINSWKADNSLIIEISDNGCGFSSKDLSNIFTLYFRGENSQQYSGSGVGLSTTKLLIDELNGNIDFEKNNPCGTIVIIKIPLEE